MTEPTPVDPATILPPLGELADAEDDLGWERERDGLMADAAAPDDAVATMRVLPAPGDLA
jgi:hypothetical protein